MIDPYSLNADFLFDDNRVSLISGRAYYFNVYFDCFDEDVYSIVRDKSRGKTDQLPEESDQRCSHHIREASFRVRIASIPE